jgi:hypothetical protein
MSREAAEEIVRQEREAKEQMPVYKGLENFKIVEKMGESVVLLISPRHRCSSSTVALFQTYIMPSTSQRIRKSPVSKPSPAPSLPASHRPLVKVVRKFELNASQVSLSLSWVHRNALAI